MAGGFIPAHGGYRKLLSYQKAEIVYDATVYFCNRYVDRRSRTHDQMVQAARSGKQNIVEASMASGTSKETEIKLTNVARASLEELLADYHDFLRTGGHRIWEKDSKEALYVRNIGREKKDSSHETNTTHKANTTYASFDATFKQLMETRPAEVSANIVICLINQANYLLDRQIRQLEQAFVKEGGLRERMTRARLDERNKIRR
jgi:four helix bundle suffix protein